MIVSQSEYEPRAIIDTSITLVRKTSPESIFDDYEPYLIRDGLPHQFRKRVFRDLKSGFQSLVPLTLVRATRFLFLQGKDGSYCVYSNSDSGAAGSLVESMHARSNFDSLWYVNQRPYDFYSKHNMQTALEKYGDMISRILFILYYTRGWRDEKNSRSIRCTNYVHRPLDCSTWGDVLPFESESDCKSLRKGQPPRDEMLAGFVAHFGWPSPRCRAFVDFVQKIELYEYFFEDKSMLLPEPAAQELLNLPAEWGR